MQTVTNKNLTAMWLDWHFSQMPAFLLQLWQNYFWFTWDFFSIKLLLLTLFSTWRQTETHYSKRFSIGDYFAGLIYNMYSRLMGAMVRLAVVAIGLVAQMTVVLLGVAVFMVWYTLPFAVIVLAFLFFYV